MSTTQRSSASTSDRPEYPEIRAEYGEDPARFLYNPRGDDVPALAFARIRGIESLDLLQEWLRVEVDLGPRREAIAALNQRQRELQGGESA